MQTINDRVRTILCAVAGLAAPAVASGQVLVDFEGLSEGFKGQILTIPTPAGEFVFDEPTQNVPPQVKSFAVDFGGVIPDPQPPLRPNGNVLTIGGFSPGGNSSASRNAEYRLTFPAPAARFGATLLKGSDSGDGDLDFRVLGLDAAGNVLETSPTSSFAGPSGSFHFFAYDFQTIGGVAAVRTEVVDDFDGLSYDNLVTTFVPEPASAGLAVTATALGLRRRRRGSR